MENISIIAAVATNNAIGNKGDLLWHLPEDLQYFKRITNGHTVVMGLRTWNSLPVKPLPNRRNIVLSDVPLSIDGVEVCLSIEELLRIIKKDEQVFIIGGGIVYNQFFDLADTLYITQVLHDFEADTFFPVIFACDWAVVKESEIFTDKKSKLKYQFLVYSRFIRLKDLE
ncbi:MAG: dihydrofolate reductase [Bacteroidales bacterium]|jgi:dihydrofolate reductase|nr:dihydrofolate reductase [Bacteroidales bacterium]